MKGKKVILGFLFFFTVSSLSASEPLTSSEMEAERAKLREKMQKVEARTMEYLQKTNPALYEERVRMKEVSQKIQELLRSFRSGKLDEAAARRRLSPLVRQSLEKRIQNLDREIELAEKRLTYLKKAKKDPALLVDQQIDFYFGKQTPEDRQWLRF